MPTSPTVDGVVRVEGHPVEVRVLGSGPPVLLLHGSGPGTTAAAAWRPTAETLAERFLLVCPDQAGFGGTPVPAGHGAGRSLWTAQAVALMDMLGHDRYAIVGHSMGGAVALSVAASRPDAVRAIVGIGCLGAEMPLPDGLERLWAARPTRADARAVLALIAGDPDAPVADETVEVRLEAMTAQGSDAYAALFPPPREQWVDDLALGAAELGSIDIPVLLVQGSRDRVVPLLPGVLALLEQLPRADLYVLGGCGHSPHLERPGLVNRLIADFLSLDA